MALDAATLLAGPRGRHLCLAVAHRLHEPVRSAWLGAAWHPNNLELRTVLYRALEEVDPSPVAGWADTFSFADPMDESVSSAMGWQEPHGEDLVAADPAVVVLLEPIAAAISRAPASQWWATGLTLDTQRYTSRYDAQFPATAPELDGLGARLATWRAGEDEDDRRARADRPDDPTAAGSGHWWSTPAFAAVSTTRALPGVGSVRLLWEEDSFSQWDALVWPLRPTRTPRVFEIDGPAAWIELVRRYPLDVTWSRRQDWYRVTGTDSTWLIPDWQAVSQDIDAVHLTVAGYLATATRRLDIHPDTATVLCGWNPDQTWWLTDILTQVGPSRHWQTDRNASDILERWHVTEP